VGINGTKTKQPNKSLHLIFTPLRSAKNSEFRRWAQRNARDWTQWFSSLL